MNTQKRQKFVVISFSLPKSYHDRMKKMAGKMDISTSDFLRRAVDFYEDEYNKKLYGRYGGFQVARGKETRLIKEEKQAAVIEMLKSAPIDEVLDYLIRIGYLDRDEDLGDKTRTYRLRDEELGRILYQIDIENESGKEVYKRSVFNIEELISDLKKNKKL